MESNQVILEGLIRYGNPQKKELPPLQVWAKTELILNFYITPTGCGTERYLCYCIGELAWKNRERIHAIPAMAKIQGRLSSAHPFINIETEKEDISILVEKLEFIKEEDAED